MRQIENQLDCIKISNKIHGNQEVFNKLLKQHIAKAKVGIQSLKRAVDKRKYNAYVRHLIKNKLYFESLYNSIQRSLNAYLLVSKIDNNHEIFYTKKEGVSNV